MTAIFKKEFKSYFTNMIGYIFISVILVFVGIYAVYVNFVNGSAAFENALSSVNIIFIILIPLLTMSVFSVEKKQKTDQLLYALPLRMSQVVLGKYLALCTVLLIPCLVMAAYPLLLSLWGTVNLPTAYGALIAFFLLGAALLSVGMFVSAMTENQVASAVITLICMLILYLTGDLAAYLSPMSRASLIALCIAVAVLCALLYLLCRNLITSLVLCVLGVIAVYWYYVAEPLVFYGLFANILRSLSLFDRFYTFINGVFDLRHAVYFLSFAAVFLLLTVQALEKRRWAE